MNNKIYKGAVFFDIDGTLVDERLGISVPPESTKNAIAALREKGYITGIATGRAKCYLPDMGIDFDCFVTCNGAVVEINDEVIVNEHIPKDKLNKVIDYLEKNDFGYNVETREICYYGERTKDKMFEMFNHFNITANCFTPLKSTDNLKVNKVLVSFDDIAQFEKLKEVFSEDFLITRHHNNNSGDVSFFNATKATGIEAIINHLGIKVSDTYAFGDDANDLEMLTFAGCGIAMTPHSALLDGVAKYITGGVGENGIYNALTHLGLID